MSYFKTSFQPSYQRNNKDSGQKNLRCFPGCCPKGHVARGYCGCAVSVGAATEDRMAWTMFALEGSQLEVKVGDELSLLFASKTKTRTRKSPGLPWIKGDSVEGGFNFNSERLGWHYGWISNVHTSGVSHVLRCAIFQRKGDVMICVDVTESPAFQVYCSRRKRKGVDTLVDHVPANDCLTPTLKRSKSDVFQIPSLIDINKRAKVARGIPPGNPCTQSSQFMTLLQLSTLACMIETNSK